MSPLEISEHRTRWMMKNHYSVKVHSDLKDVCKDWCKAHLKPQEWQFTAWTCVYEHTFNFETQKASQQFEALFT